MPKLKGPAAAAGIEAGDVVTTINGTPLSKSADFEDVIAQFAPGSFVHLTTLRDGELFDRTITLGYGRCPSGLSSANLAASQAADAFPSLKKPTKLYDAGQLTPGAPLLLSSIRHLIDQSARLKNEVNSTLLSIDKFDDEINCTGMEFRADGTTWLERASRPTRAISVRSSFRSTRPLPSKVRTARFMIW